MISIIKLVFKSLPLVLLFTLTLALHFSNITPFQRGFFCDDHNLKYPYIESETVPKYICLLIWFVISIFTIITTQILLNSKLGISNQFKQLFTGVLGCILFTDLAQYSVGRLRPHFLSLCNHDYNYVCFTRGGKNILISANRVRAQNIFCENARFTTNIYMNPIDKIQGF